jgi:hypothetical protein
VRMCEFWPAEKAHLYCIIVVTANPRHVFLFKITWQLTVFEKTLNAPHHTTPHHTETRCATAGGASGQHGSPGERGQRGAQSTRFVPSVLPLRSTPVDSYRYDEPLLSYRHLICYCAMQY